MKIIYWDLCYAIVDIDGLYYPITTVGRRWFTHGGHRYDLNEESVKTIIRPRKTKDAARKMIYRAHKRDEIAGEILGTGR
jgi:hypothetical protein